MSGPNAARERSWSSRLNRAWDSDVGLRHNQRAYGAFVRSSTKWGKEEKTRGLMLDRCGTEA